MKTKEYFDQFAAKLDCLAWNVDTAPWADWAWEIVEQEISTAERCRIVDLGTGTGSCIENLVRFTRDASFLGVDFSEEMIRRARRKKYEGAEVEFTVCRLDKLKLPTESIDYFISSGTFHHIKNKLRVLTNLASMVKPGGKFINMDQFRPGEAYHKEMMDLRSRRPREAAANDRVREKFQWIYDQDTGHPIEFAVDPYEFRDMAERCGFDSGTVFVSLQPGFAVVSMKKAG